MKSFIGSAIIGVMALAVSGYAQDSKKQPVKSEITKAMYMVPNQHCPLCATALEASMKKIVGIKSTTVNYPNKFATVDFDESVISAQEVARAMFQSPHAMGANMKYYAFMVLSVPDTKDKASGAKATAALKKVEGVANVTFYPQTKSVAIHFSEKGKVTSSDLFNALEQEGLKGRQYGAKK